MQKTFAGAFFIALFGSLLLVFRFANHVDWTIHNWDGVISWATAEDLDIGKRIGSFYKSFGIFFLAFAFLLFLLYRFGERLFSANELSILNYLSLAGCMLLFFKLIGHEFFTSENSSFGLDESLKLLFVIQLLLVIYASADFFLSGFKRTQSLPVHELAWSVIMGACAFFLLDYFFLLFNDNAGDHFNLWLLGFSAAGLHFSFWARRRGKSNDLYKWIISIRPVALIPVWFVLSQEIYMILNQHGIFSIHPVMIFLFLLLIAILQIVRTNRKERNSVEPEPRVINAIANFYFPWLIAGLITFTCYRPIVEAPQEIFEQANPALSIQQYYEFGKLPWLQTFSSHSGADFISGFIYSMLNGFSGLSYHCYDFLVFVVYVLLLYYTIKNLTGNAYLAFLSLLLYPYLDLLLPQYHNIMLVPLLILAATLNAPSAKNYFFLFSSLILMPLWRYDLGYGNIVALIVSMFIFMIFRKELRANIPSLKKGFLFALILPALLLVFVLIKNQQSIFINMKDALAYLNSGQAFGVKELASEKNLVYYVHYFIFPCAVAICFFFGIYRLVLLSKKEERLPFGIVAVIFLSIYYFANFHRGLIRHNLAEGWDTAFTSFGFFIVTATVYDLLRTKNHAIRIAAVCAFTTLIIAGFKYPQPELSNGNYYGDVRSSVKTPVLAGISEVKNSRAPVKEDFAKETFNDLKEFLDKNISPDATFLDFSNTPMLYLYTHRQTPNYFNQIPHTAVNVYLQQRFIEELKQYKIPVVLFSNSPALWWDSFDGIPNTYRHYLIAEYIFKHYRPYDIINRHSVWIEKGNKLITDVQAYPKDTVSVQVMDQQLQFLPYVMGKNFPSVVNDSLTLFKKITPAFPSLDGGTEGLYELSSPVKNEEANYIVIKAKNLSGKREDVRFSFANNGELNGSFRFYLKEDGWEHTYLIRLSTQYNWYNKENNRFRLKMTEGKCVVTELNLMKGKAQQ